MCYPSLESLKKALVQYEKSRGIGQKSKHDLELCESKH